MTLQFPNRFALSENNFTDNGYIPAPELKPCITPYKGPKSRDGLSINEIMKLYSQPPPGGGRSRRFTYIIPSAAAAVLLLGGAAVSRQSSKTPRPTPSPVHMPPVRAQPPISPKTQPLTSPGMAYVAVPLATGLGTAYLHRRMRKASRKPKKTSAARKSLRS